MDEPEDSDYHSSCLNQNSKIKKFWFLYFKLEFQLIQKFSLRKFDIDTQIAMYLK